MNNDIIKYINELEDMIEKQKIIIKKQDELIKLLKGKTEYEKR